MVAYSGGADSTALLHALAHSGVAVVAAHLHHGLRAEADLEMERCRQLAGSLGVPFVEGRADVAAHARENGMSIELAGRELRRRFLGQVLEHQGAEWVATGHTADDQLETLLMRLARGSGTEGMGGIAPVARPYVRPLLEAERDETRGYCLRHGLWFHDDPANEDRANARSAIRHGALPAILAAYPGARQAAARLAAGARADAEVLGGLADRALERAKVPTRLAPGIASLFQCRFRVAALLEEPWGLHPWIVRAACRSVGVLLGARQTTTAVAGLRSQPAGCVAAGAAGRFVWRDGVARAEANAAGMDARALPADGPGWAAGMGQAAADYAATTSAPGEWSVRTARPGDSINGRSLDGLLRDAGFCRAARASFPVFCLDGRPSWAPGVALSGAVAATEHQPDARRLFLALGPGRSGRAHGTVVWRQT